MTPSEIETMAREQYNAVGDTFWSQAEIFRLIYAASMEMAKECLVVERTYTTTTVASTQEYAFPTNTISIKRATWYGKKLHPINFREDDALTQNNSATTASGNPQYYTEWNYTIALRPIPSTAQTLKLYTYSMPQAVSVTSTLDVPVMFHTDIVDFILYKMLGKDKNPVMMNHYFKLWIDHKLMAKQWALKKKKQDAYPVVMDEEQMAQTLLGVL